MSGVHLYLDDFGVIATDLLESDAQLEDQIKSAISKKNLKLTLKIITEKALEARNTQPYDQISIMKIAYEIFAIAFEDFEGISLDQKLLMAKTINKNLIESSRDTFVHGRFWKNRKTVAGFKYPT